MNNDIIKIIAEIAHWKMFSHVIFFLSCMFCMQLMMIYSLILYNVAMSLYNII